VKVEKKGTTVFLRPFFAVTGTENVINTPSSELIKRDYKDVYILESTITF